MATFNINTVLSQLTLEEKVQLLAGADEWHTHAVPRLGVPLIRMSDGPNGIRGTRFFNGSGAATLPCGAALAATFNKNAVHAAGCLLGVEAKHKGAHVVLGPTVNLPRSPLGGRGFECYSEDPVLSGLTAASLVRGIQAQGIAATLKHFVCNDMEGDRLGVNVQVSQRALRELYLMPFQLALRDACPRALMTSYNRVNGTHSSQSKSLIRDILRGEWGYEGTVMSDWMGCYALKEAVDAGLDLEMPGPPVIRRAKALVHAVKTNEIHLTDLDDRVRSVLRLVHYCQGSGIGERASENSLNDTSATTAQLRTLAAESIVLLKNEGGLLPLATTDSLAVIGPNAQIAVVMGGGSASVRPYHTVTPYEGICAKHETPVPFTIGATSNKMLPALGPQLRRPDGSVGFVARFYLEPFGSSPRTLIDEMNLEDSYMYMNDYTNGRFEKVVYIDFEGTFTPSVSGMHEFGVAVYGDAELFVDEILVVDNKTVHHPGVLFFSQSTLEERGQIHLEQGRAYQVRVAHGSPATSVNYNDCLVILSGAGGIQFGAMVLVDPQDEIKRAVALSQTVDKVVLVVGLTKEWESEGYDRKDMKLPGFTDDLVTAVVQANPNVIVVNQSGAPVGFPWIKKVPAVVQAWYGGNELGNALADVLYGDVNPSGKLPVSWPVCVEDNPTFLHFTPDRGHVWYGEDIYVGYRFYEKVRRLPLFPFGFGLSYTLFALSLMEIQESKGVVTVAVTITNTGKVLGLAVLQLYVSALTSSVQRPLRELKEFAKVSVAPGEAKRTHIAVPVKYATAYFDESFLLWNCESGVYEFSVVETSLGGCLKKTYEVTQGFRWSGK